MLFTLLTDSSLQCHIVVKIVALFLTLVEIFLVFPIKILTLQLKYVCVCMYVCKHCHIEKVSFNSFFLKSTFLIMKRY